MWVLDLIFVLFLQTVLVCCVLNRRARLLIRAPVPPSRGVLSSKRDRISESTDDVVDTEPKVHTLQLTSLPVEILAHVICVLDASTSDDTTPEDCYNRDMWDVRRQLRRLRTFERQWRTTTALRSTCTCTHAAVRVWMRTVRYAPFHEFTDNSQKRCKLTLAAIVASAHLFVNLHSVSFRGWNIDDFEITKFVEALGRGAHCKFKDANPLLRHLDVSQTNVGDAGLWAIATNCPHLVSLDVSCTKITDLGLECVAIAVPRVCVELEHLSVSTAASGIGLACLARNCARLVSVRAGTLTESIAVDLVESCERRLTHLEFGTLQPSGMSDATMKQVASTCPHLHSLKIFAYGCLPRTNDAAIISISRHCSLLHTVRLDCDSSTDVGICALARGCPNLEDVCLVETWSHNLTDASVEALVRACRKLRVLNVHTLALLTDTSVVALVACDCLTHVFLPNNVSEHAVESLRRTKPQLVLA